MTSLVFVGENGDNALTYYRQIVPGAVLAQRAGWDVKFAPILTETEDGRLTGWRAGYVPAPPPDVIVVRHLLDPADDARVLDSVDMLTQARAKGQRVYYDLDDNLWDLPDDNPAKRFYAPDQLGALEANLNACDGVLVSTPPLAATVRRHLAGVPVHVCPNGILVDPFAVERDRTRRPIRLGWLGLMDFRQEDLRSVLGELTAVLDRRSDVTFSHLGASPSRPSIRTLIADCEEVPWCQFSAMPDQIAQIDVALVPMRDLAINESRSPTTGLALAASGVPVLASAMPAYVELSERVPGVYVITNDNWSAGLEAILDAYAEGRVPAPEDMRRAVRRHYGPGVVAESWRRALSAAGLVSVRH